jgi:hypothetical protein
MPIRIFDPTFHFSVTQFGSQPWLINRTLQSRMAAHDITQEQAVAFQRQQKQSQFSSPDEIIINPYL